MRQSASRAFFGVLAGAIAATASPWVLAQANNYGLPIKPTRFIEFTTTEGTQMSVDVSPDGRTVVFDLLGDLYIVPISGGRATQLTSGMAWDQHPRYSPDGKLIAFVSDRSGTENIWFMNAMGGNQRQATHERDVYAMLQPSWTPDQRSLFGPSRCPRHGILRRAVAIRNCQAAQASRCRTRITNPVG